MSFLSPHRSVEGTCKAASHSRLHSPSAPHPPPSLPPTPLLPSLGDPTFVRLPEGAASPQSRFTKQTTKNNNNWQAQRGEKAQKSGLPLKSTKNGGCRQQEEPDTPLCLGPS